MNGKICGTILAAAVAVAATANAGSPETLRIVQWNVGHFAMGKSCDPTVAADASAERAAAYRAKIAELDADFLGVSEYDPVFDVVGTPATNAVFASFPTRIEGPKNNYQSNAVFSRLPCVRSSVVDFAARRQRTYFLDTVFRIGTNEVHFVQTHLDWNSSEEATDARPRQIRQMIDYLGGFPHVIICADFNVYGAGEYYPFLMAGYSLANCGAAGCLDTVISKDRKMPCRRYPLDNIVVKGFAVGDVFLDDTDCRLSDHRIIGCTLKIMTK